jgi:hypothetical protein
MHLAPAGSRPLVVRSMPSLLEDFRPLVPAEVLDKFGPLVELFPKRTFDRSALSQFGLAVVAAAAAAGCVAVSFLVVISDQPDEQLPFQQAMWGLAAALGTLALYGLGTGLSRAIFGIESVGQWWLLLERGLVIVNSGKLKVACPLEELRIKTATQIGSQFRLLDADDRSLPLPLGAEEKLIAAVFELKRQARDRETPAGPARVPYALAWAEAKWFGEDRVFRLYPDGKTVLVLYAGQFLPEQVGIDSSSVLPVAVGLVAGVALSYNNRLVGKDFAKRAAYLDALSIEELRAEGRTNDASQILTPAATTEIHLGPAATRFWSNDLLKEKVTGRLTFKHQRKTWELAFFTPQERDFSLEVFRQAFGDQRVTSTLT